MRRSRKNAAKSSPADAIIEKALKDGSTALSLRGVNITSVPPAVFEMSTLVHLNLSSNQLTDLPPELERLTNLVYLGVHQNPFTRIPDVVFSLKNLEILDISFTPITEIDYRIGTLKKLWTINAYSTRISTLPVTLTDAESLFGIHLGRCDFTEFPLVLTKCRRLSYVELDYNKINSLPDEICDLRSLTTLNAKNNHIIKLPDIFDKFEHLEEIELSHNDISLLPPSFKALSKLKKLNLNGNPLNLPPASYELPPADLLTLYFTLNDPSGRSTTIDIAQRPLNEAKMLVVGQGGVGKTSLIRRLQGEGFEPKEPETKGIKIRTFGNIVGEEDLRINIWDFGGQEIMHATHQFFFTDGSLYVLVIDCRQGEQESRLEYWLKLIASFGGESPVIVVCNRADENRLELDWAGLQRKYPSIRHFVRAASARTGEGVDELLHKIRETASALDHVHQPLPDSWLRVKDRLGGLRDTRNYLSYRDYQSICSHEGVTEEASQKSLVRLLTALGIVLNFADDRRLKDTNVLEPNWVTNGVYSILNCHELFQSHGVLSLEDLAEILPADIYPPEQHSFIIDMMKKFELCFQFEGAQAERYLVADLLPLSEPDTGTWDNALRFEYHYDVLPGSVISRFIVRMHRFISQHTYWRRGVVLEREGHRALVRADLEDRTISIYIVGRQNERRIMLDLVRADFERIHETIPKLQVAEKIPIPGHPGALVDYRHLRTLRDVGEVTFIPEGMSEHIPVAALLGEIETAADREQRRSAAPPEPARAVRSDPKQQPLIHPLLVFVVGLALIATVGLLAGGGVIVLPIAVIGALLIVVLVHSLEEHRAGRLGEKAFLTLVKDSFAQLRLFRLENKVKG